MVSVPRARVTSILERKAPAMELPSRERESERKTVVTRVCFYRAKRRYLLGGSPLWFTGVHSSLVAAALEFIDNRLPT